MRKSLGILAVLVYMACFFVGCESVKRTYSAYEACRNDASCYAQMEKGRDLTTALTSSALAAIPHTAPVATVVGSGAGMLASLILGIYLGKKKEK